MTRLTAFAERDTYGSEMILASCRQPKNIESQMRSFALAHGHLHFCWQVPGTWYWLNFISFREGGRPYLCKQTSIADTSSTATVRSMLITENNGAGQGVRNKSQKKSLSNRPPDERTWSACTQLRACSACSDDKPGADAVRTPS